MRTFKLYFFDVLKIFTLLKKNLRCWLFAMLNVARQPFVKQHNIEDFEFSQVIETFIQLVRDLDLIIFLYQGHLFYWDKIERANYFLHNIVLTARRGEEV